MIQQIQQLVSINSLARRKQYHLEHLRDALEKLPKVRPGAYKNRIFHLLKEHRKAKVRIAQLLQAAMHERFVEIEYECHLAGR